MKNFIFKSSADFHKIVFNKLEMIQSELRHQRGENQVIIGLLTRIFNNSTLQTQVDDYYDETSHQTESLEQNEPNSSNPNSN